MSRREHDETERNQTHNELEHEVQPGLVFLPCSRRLEPEELQLDDVVMVERAHDLQLAVLRNVQGDERQLAAPRCCGTEAGGETHLEALVLLGALDGDEAGAALQQLCLEDDAERAVTRLAEDAVGERDLVTRVPPRRLDLVDVRRVDSCRRWRWWSQRGRRARACRSQAEARWPSGGSGALARVEGTHLAALLGERACPTK